MKMMKSKYFIYHIPGVKIGVSNNPDSRTKIQGFSEYEILEEHTNAKEVSKREKILQAQYGYPVDKIEYWKTLRWQKKASTKKARKKAVANTDFKALNIKRIANTDFEKLSKKRTLKLQKLVNQYDLEGKFIKQWDSVNGAGKIFGNINGSNIAACCRGKLKTAYKYIWKYAG